MQMTQARGCFACASTCARTAARVCWHRLLPAFRVRRRLLISPRDPAPSLVLPGSHPGHAPSPTGPALVTYNDAVFTDRDFESIQHIGGSRKTDADSKTKTGRFGVGFNSSYHVTDLPGFVSRKYLVLLDPHCAHMPNASRTEPGKMLNFTKPGMKAQYADQLAPFELFGNTMEGELGDAQNQGPQP